MSDMINRDEVLAIIADLKKDYPTHSVPDAEAKVALRKVADKVKNLPTIDIVQCGECIYAREQDGYYECDYSKIVRDPEGYCDIGERKESE